MDPDDNVFLLYAGSIDKRRMSTFERGLFGVFEMKHIYTSASITIIYGEAERLIALLYPKKLRMKTGIIIR